ncbi:hypothetical protein PEP31012_03573 [Pandoraea eparura]|uniref:LysM domain-containing protein n=1 Tax=Pandoraea eparura TaxID=2508291 RepID=A0A5E4WX73_9BURK|nr:hypothetical protein [Pandoraea eparura]VVE29121.1 hypothetical protein PEP31012_03573 [Pandoraea eparura]
MSPYEPRPEGLNTDPAPPSVVETLKPRTYTTKPAESVMGIALRQCGNEDAWRQILAWNPRFEFLASSDYFPVGTVLVMPPHVRAAEPPKMGGDEQEAYRADMIAAGAKDLGNGTWELDGGDFLFQLWRHARAALSADGGEAAK